VSALKFFNNLHNLLGEKAGAAREIITMTYEIVQAICEASCEGFC